MLLTQISLSSFFSSVPSGILTETVKLLCFPLFPVCVCCFKSFTMNRMSLAEEARLGLTFQGVKLPPPLAKPASPTAAFPLCIHQGQQSKPASRSAPAMPTKDLSKQQPHSHRMTTSSSLRTKPPQLASVCINPVSRYVYSLFTPPTYYSASAGGSNNAVQRGSSPPLTGGKPGHHRPPGATHQKTHRPSLRPG